MHKLNKLFILSVLALPIPAVLFADDSPPKPVASHAAGTIAQLLAVSGTQATLREEFDATVTELVKRLQDAGFPQATIDEIRGVLAKWFDQEIKWAEIEPQLVTVYQNTFTEEELDQLLAFYQTPVGKKVATKLPSLALATVSIRQAYANGKQESLNQSIEAVLKKNPLTP